MSASTDMPSSAPIARIAAPPAANPPVSPAPVFTLGPFAVDGQGRLSPRADAASAPGFVFHWRDRLVHAQLTGPAQGTGELALEATLGRVPSSASVESPARRARSFALLRSLPPLLPPDWTMRLLPDHRIHLRVGTKLALPVTAIGLVTALTGFLMTLAPYLDLLDEDGVAAGKLPAGNVPAGNVNV